MQAAQAGFAQAWVADIRFRRVTCELVRVVSMRPVRLYGSSIYQIIPELIRTMTYLHQTRLSSMSFVLGKVRRRLTNLSQKANSHFLLGGIVIRMISRRCYDRLAPHVEPQIKQPGRANAQHHII